MPRVLPLVCAVLLCAACLSCGWSGDSDAPPGPDPAELAKQLDEARSELDAAVARAERAEARLAQLESERDQALGDRIRALEEAAAAREAALSAEKTRNLWLGFGGGALVMTLVLGIALGSRTRRAAANGPPDDREGDNALPPGAA